VIDNEVCADCKVGGKAKGTLHGSSMRVDNYGCAVMGGCLGRRESHELRTTLGLEADLNCEQMGLNLGMSGRAQVELSQVGWISVCKRRVGGSMKVVERRRASAVRCLLHDQSGIPFTDAKPGCSRCFS
jgi:hypothetical protein